MKIEINNITISRENNLLTIRKGEAEIILDASEVRAVRDAITIAAHSAYT
ncbi:hypothetical protein HO100_08565 [Corynebacterium ulcerans]|uniref:Uncharacterized protein n=1 Tax=Corynebacterium ulcerans FRC58 TaxID=1408268 RepID=A0ABM5U256_CORUL|nr:hypothetical protein [Corynebacterium ulcerans]AKN77559.1 Hypothetical protein CulFRC58_1705 [Corynebacterium ulcerans FRC58]NOL62833.1 hypothetical protein [Corynebacterium ulcerans]NON15651.1 hypothetical protein [Corynebacterium ulcerans]